MMRRPELTLNKYCLFINMQRGSRGKRIKKMHLFPLLFAQQREGWKKFDVLMRLP